MLHNQQIKSVSVSLISEGCGQSKSKSVQVSTSEVSISVVLMVVNRSKRVGRAKMMLGRVKRMLG